MRVEKKSSNETMASYRVAIVKWADRDGIAEAIHYALNQLGYEPVYFLFDWPIPPGVKFVFTFAPYGRLLPILRKIADMPDQGRPISIHWDTEGIPNPKIPWALLKTLGDFFSWSERLNESDSRVAQRLANTPPLSLVNKTAFRIRLDGHYHYAYRKGWLDLFVETSEIYARISTDHGLPTIYVPWGTHPEWHADLKLERDIDILWMGTRRSKRRQKLVDRIHSELANHGIQMYVVDGVENPFIYDGERNVVFNRSKITLNLLPAWYFNSFTFKFHLAAGNRSLVVSEPILPHCPNYKPGIHYVSSPISKLTDTILHYLDHDDEREQITEKAFNLVTKEMTFMNSVRTIMEEAAKLREHRRER
jgi:hypothetical protein